MATRTIYAGVVEMADADLVMATAGTYSDSFLMPELKHFVLVIKCCFVPLPAFGQDNVALLEKEV